MLCGPGAVGLTPLVLTLAALVPCGVARAATGPIAQLALNESGIASQAARGLLQTLTSELVAANRRIALRRSASNNAANAE